MKNFLSKITYSDKLLFGLTALISLITFCFYFFSGQENLAYYDAVARLNTARKMIDSLTPGIGQLGGIWLPLPTLLWVPFVQNDFLWHTGIAGYIVSGLSFIFGAVYLQKTVYLLTKKRNVALLTWFLFVSNLNVLLLQTMAMSESFFFCFFILTFYHLFRWIQEHKLSNFMLTAFSGMVLTLTRYEGYFILFAVFLAVVIECIMHYTKRQKEKIEGMLLLFLTISGFGIILWCIYAALFYKNPLYWLHSYTPIPPEVLAAYSSLIGHVYGIPNPNLFQSLQIYSSVTMWTNGIITVLLGLLGVVLYALKPTRKFFPLMLVTIILFIGLVVGYFKGFIPHIEFPTVFLQGELAVRDWSINADNNVRYGIILLPCILLFAALAAARSKFLYIVVLLFAFEQLFFSAVKPQLFQYTFTHSWKYPHASELPWWNANYDGGLVLISSSVHEDLMFQTNLPYKTFIYEGTRDYWTESLNKPSTHARWVVFNNKVLDDKVNLHLTNAGKKDLEKNYTLVHKDRDLHFFKLKDGVVTTNSLTK